MKFICLPGRYTNAETMKAQLGPLCALMTDDPVEFCFIDPPFPRDPGPEYVDFFGPPPHRCWYSFALTPEEEQHYILENPFSHQTEESVVSIVNQLTETIPPDQLQQSLDTVFTAIEKEGDVTGIIGFSEGASMATNLILEEQRRQRENGPTYKPRIKLAVLFSGTLPLQIVGDHVEPVLENGDPVTVPSLHVISATDPFIAGNLVLHRLFDPDTADILDHGTGHLVPRDVEILHDFRIQILQMISSLDVFT